MSISWRRSWHRGPRCCRRARPARVSPHPRSAMRRGEGRQRNGRGGSVGRSARIVSRLRIIGESGLRACGGRRDHARLGGSGLGTHRDHRDLQHFRRDVRERPSKVLVARRQRLLERVLHGAPLPLPGAPQANCAIGLGNLDGAERHVREHDEWRANLERERDARCEGQARLVHRDGARAAVVASEVDLRGWRCDR